MKPSDQDINSLIKLSRQAPQDAPDTAPPGFAARIARASSSGEAGSEIALEGAIRWTVIACAAVTLLVAAANFRSLTAGRFAPLSAFESHVSDRALGLR